MHTTSNRLFQITTLQYYDDNRTKSRLRSEKILLNCRIIFHENKKGHERTDVDTPLYRPGHGARRGDRPHFSAHGGGRRVAGAAKPPADAHGQLGADRHVYLRRRPHDGALGQPGVGHAPVDEAAALPRTGGLRGDHQRQNAQSGGGRCGPNGGG